MSDPAPCGTYAAAMRHKRNGEPMDGPCRNAVRDYIRQLRAARPDIRKRDRWWNKTRARALERLAEEYPERLAELIADERAGWNPWKETA